MDTFFNSPILQETLFENGILPRGTVRANCKGMPNKFKSDKEIKRGDIEYFSSGAIRCIKWMNNRAVLLLSNFISPEEKSWVKRRTAGSAEKIDVPVPK